MKVIFSLLLVSIIATHNEAYADLLKVLDFKGVSSLCKSLGLGKGDVGPAELKSKFSDYIRKRVKVAEKKLDQMYRELKGCADKTSLEIHAKEVIDEIEGLIEDIKPNEVEKIEHKCNHRLEELKKKLKEVNELTRHAQKANCKREIVKIHKFLSDEVAEIKKETADVIAVLLASHSPTLLKNLKLLQCK